MNSQAGEVPPDYLIIGHITQDQDEEGYRLGGTAVYSGVLAHRLGLKVAVYTSGTSQLNLEIMDGIEIIDQPGPGTTTFINDYTPSGRTQRLLDKAEELDLNCIPEEWKQAKIIHLAPVAGEVPLTAGEEFSGGFLGYSLQGWMRIWDEKGKISPSPFPPMNKPVRKNALGVLSIEDLGEDRSGLESLQRQFPTLALTMGAEGVEIYSGSRSHVIPAPLTTEIDPTGAGDIFAAALMIFWKIKELPIEEAAQVANTLAAASVKKPGIAGIPAKREISEILKVHR